MRPLLYLLIAGMLLIAASCNKNTEPSLCPDCPVITAISPSSGAPGDVITITGEKFDGLEFVIFDNNQQVAVDPQMTTSTETKVAVPDLGKNGSVKVQVARRFTSGGGGTTTLRSEEDILFTYVQGPLITGFSPVSGKKGDIITITGKFFGNNPVVLFPSAPATTIVSMSDTLIQVVVPAKAGSGFIQVKNGSLTGQSAAGFTHQVQFTSSVFAGLADAPGDVLANGDLNAARFNKPYRMVSAGNGIFYVWDSGNNKIKRISTLTNSVTTLTSLPANYQFANCDGCGNLRIDADGILYIAANDAFNESVILRINPTSGVVSTAMSMGYTSGYIFDFDIDELKNFYITYINSDPSKLGLYRYNLSALTRINNLITLPIDPNAEALSVDCFNGSIYLGIKPSVFVLNNSGSVQQTIGNDFRDIYSLLLNSSDSYFFTQSSDTKVADLYFRENTGTQPLFQVPYEFPSGLCLDVNGDLYVVDLGKHVIFKTIVE